MTVKINKLENDVSDVEKTISLECIASARRDISEVCCYTADALRAWRDEFTESQIAYFRLGVYFPIFL